MKNTAFNELRQGVRQAGVYLRGSKKIAARTDVIASTGARLSFGMNSSRKWNALASDLGYVVPPSGGPKKTA